MSGRIRTIKPEILDDEAVAAMPHGVFRLFIASIVLADDYGNFRAEPRQLFGRVYVSVDGATPADAQNFRDQLAAIGRIELYRVRGQTYAHVTNWDRHQKVDHPGKPKVPKLDDPEAERLFPRLDDVGVIRESLANVHESLARTSESLATDQDQDQDQEEDLDQDSGIARAGALPPKVRRGRQAKPETDCPPTEASAEDVASWASRWGISTTHAEFMPFLEHHRSRGTRMRDWGAGWRKWLLNGRRWGGKAATQIQQTDLEAPWMKAAKGV